MAKKDWVEAIKELRALDDVSPWGKLPKHVKRLCENWDSLPGYIQDAILILGRVRRISAGDTAEIVWRRRKGENPEWLLAALNILKDSSRYLTDREIAGKVGVNRSTLCRNEAYRNAKRTYLQPFLTIGRRGLRADAED